VGVERGFDDAAGDDGAGGAEGGEQFAASHMKVKTTPVGMG
jgi:hypothetical protein